MEPSQIDLLISLIQTHAWLPASAILIGVTIRAIKAGWVSTLLAKFNVSAVPPEWLPKIALGLGVLLAAVEAAVEGKPLLPEIVKGLVAAMGAIAGHEAVMKPIERAAQRRKEPKDGSPE